MHWKWPNKYVQVKISLSTVHSPVISVISHSPNTAGCLNRWLWNRRWNNFWIKEASRKLRGDWHSQYYYPNPPHNGLYSIVRLFVHPTLPLLSTHKLIAYFPSDYTSLFSRPNITGTFFFLAFIQIKTATTTAQVSPINR